MNYIFVNTWVVRLFSFNEVGLKRAPDTWPRAVTDNEKKIPSRSFAGDYYDMNRSKNLIGGENVNARG